jgi:hypothetical protein
MKKVVTEKQGDKYVIKRSKPPRPTLAETEVDREKAATRRRGCSQLYGPMIDALETRFNKRAVRSEMLELAADICAERGIKLDRPAKRSKECLICWFCENVPELVGNPTLEVESRQQEKRDEVSDDSEMFDFDAFFFEFTGAMQGTLSFDGLFADLS